MTQTLAHALINHDALELDFNRIRDQGRIFKPMIVDPRSVPGLVAWYDARYLDLADNTSVSDWPDLLGNTSHNLKQLTTSKQPIFRANYNSNGPAVVFDAIDDLMQIDPNTDLWPSIDAGHWSACLLFEPTAIPTGTDKLIKPQLPTSPWKPGDMGFDANMAAQVTAITSGGATKTASVNNAFTVGTRSVFVGRWDVGVAVKSDVPGFGSDTNTAYTDKTSVSGSGKEIYVGANFAGSGWAHIALVALALYNRVLTDAEVEYLGNV